MLKHAAPNAELHVFGPVENDGGLDVVPRKRTARFQPEQIRDESAVTYRAAKRVAGEGGMYRKRWGRDKLKRAAA